MVSTTRLLIATIAAAAGMCLPVTAAVIMDFNFDDANQDSIAELEGLGWSFTGGTETIMAPGTSPENALRLGGNAGTQPTAAYAFDGPSSSVGAISMLIGTAASFSNSRFSFRSGGTELFAISPWSPSVLRVIGDVTYEYTGLAMNTTGVNGYEDNRVQIDLSWNGDILSYRLYQPGVGTLDVSSSVSFANAGIPDNLLWSNDTYNNANRYVLLYDIEVMAFVPEPNSMALLLAGSMLVALSRRRALRGATRLSRAA